MNPPHPTRPKKARGRASKYSMQRQSHGKWQNREAEGFGRAPSFRLQNLGSHFKLALWSADARTKLGFFASLDGRIDSNALECLGQFI